MEIKEIRNDNIIILAAKGKIDSVTSADLEKKLADALANGDILLDLSGTDYISSAGLRILLSASKKAGGLRKKLAISGLKPTVKEVFDIVGFTPIFMVYPSIEEALQALRA